MTEQFVHESLDSSFDQAFAQQMQLRWWPWVGRKFAVSPVRTMLLGESVYDWSPGKETCRSRYAQTTGLRISHVNHALRLDRDSAYVRNVERAFFDTATPSDAQKMALWHSVVYHNLVLDLLDNPKHRPSVNQYIAGWHEALRLCETLAIDQCVVYGVELPKRLALREVARAKGLKLLSRQLVEVQGRSKGRIAKYEWPNGKVLKLVFIRHPSAFFSWRKWATVFAKEVCSPMES